MASQKNLQQKLLDIMEEFGSVEKKGRNEFQNYAYVREADIAIRTQELLVKHKVFISSSVTHVSERQVPSSKGKANMYATVTVEYTMTNAEHPNEQIVVQAMGSGMDSGDKALYKALTGAHKYFLIRNFNLGSDDDAEKASPEMGAVAASDSKIESDFF